jgi:copper resistance protein C
MRLRNAEEFLAGLGMTATPRGLGTKKAKSTPGALGKSPIPRGLGAKTGKSMLGWAVVAMLVLLAAQLVEGHAVLKDSHPAANGKVAGPDVPIMLKYNVRIDAKLSKVQLLNPDNSTSDLKIEEQSAPDTLNAKATGLKPGAYRIRWQVLAPDGHITRGEVPFTVTGS